MDDIDSLRLALDGEKHNHRVDNEYLVGERDRLRNALVEICDQDPIENALDPQWAARIARAALRGYDG